MSRLVCHIRLSFLGTRNSTLQLLARLAFLHFPLSSQFILAISPLVSVAVLSSNIQNSEDGSEAHPEIPLLGMSCPRSYTDQAVSWQPFALFLSFCLLFFLFVCLVGLPTYFFLSLSLSRSLFLVVVASTCSAASFSLKLGNHDHACLFALHFHVRCIHAVSGVCVNKLLRVCAM